MAFPAWAGAAIQGASGSIADPVGAAQNWMAAKEGNKYTHDLMNKQERFNRKMYDDQRYDAKNAHSIAMNDMRMAGLNPTLAAGNPASAASASSGGAPAGSGGSGAGATGAGMDIMGAMATKEEINKLKTAQNLDNATSAAAMAKAAKDLTDAGIKMPISEFSQFLGKTFKSGADLINEIDNWRKDKNPGKAVKPTPRPSPHRTPTPRATRTPGRPGGLW